MASCGVRVVVEWEVEGRVEVVMWLPVTAAALHGKQRGPCELA